MCGCPSNVRIYTTSNFSWTHFSFIVHIFVFIGFSKCKYVFRLLNPITELLYVIFTYSKYYWWHFTLLPNSTEIQRRGIQSNWNRSSHLDCSTVKIMKRWYEVEDNSGIVPIITHYFVIHFYYLHFLQAIIHAGFFHNMNSRTIENSVEQ